MDTNPPTISFNAVTEAGNAVDDAEDGAGFEISGAIGGAAPYTDIVGNSFEVEILDPTGAVIDTVTATINPVDGTWIANVPANSFDFDGDYSLHVKDGTAADLAGNPATAADHGFAVDDDDAGIQIDAIAADDIINATELTGNLTIPFTLDADAPAAGTVTITLGSLTQTVALPAASVTFTNTDIIAAGGLPDGSLDVVAVVKDAAGDTVATDTHPITVDTASETPTIDIEGDDLLINANEAVDDVTLTGTAEPGAEVTITLVPILADGSDGMSILIPASPVTADADGNWTAVILAASLTETTIGIDDTGTIADYRVTATAVDVAGNPVSPAVTFDFEVDLDDGGGDAATIAIDTPIAGNDKVDAYEAQDDVTLSGTTDHVEAGQTVTITLGAGTYNAVVVAGAGTTGTWTVDVPAADIVALGTSATNEIAVSVVDAAGNTSLTLGEEGEPIATATANLEVDLAGPAVAIDTISDDDILDSFDVGNITVSGTTLNVEADQVVTVSANGGTNNHEVLVAADGTWTVEIPKAEFSSPVDVTANVDNVAGDSADEGVLDITVNVLAAVDIEGIDANNDSDNDPGTGISLDHDDIINATESGSPIAVYGTSNGIALGGSVTVSLGGNDYTATVTDAGGSWTVEIPAADVTALADGDVVISAVATGVVGAPTDSHTVVKESEAVIAIDQIANDDILTADETGVPLLITGTSSGLAVDAPVTLTLGGQTYTFSQSPNPAIPGDPGTSALITGNGTWEIEIPAADLAALADADLTVTVSSFFGSDPVEGTRDLTVGEGGGDVDAPTDGDDNITGTDGDDVIDGGAGDDILVGGLGDDTLTGGAGNDYLYGQDGDDVLNSGGGGDDVDVLVGGAGNDELNGDEGFSYMFGGEGEDTANGGSGTDIAYGGDDNDELNGNGGTDWLYGENGNDTLNGGADSDLLFGGAGDDTINGGAGNDWLWGDDADATGGGADTFVFEANWGVDVVYDFENGVDMIDLSGTGLAFTDLNIGQIEGGFTYLADDTFTNFIYLDGGSSPLSATDLGAEDFIF